MATTLLIVDVRRFVGPERVPDGDEALDVRRPSALRSDGLRRDAGEVAGDEHLDVELRAGDVVQ